ncbi:hypothetical protein B1R94_27715 [Mycolicibacterium litorale]|nr:hypothetical protein B1R94_27715 [Mycolicibacterium litorale]
MSAVVVTPEMLRDTQNAITSALEHATAIANGYLTTHENIGAAAWAGMGQDASRQTATQINHDLNQAVMGGTRLAEGLGRAAAHMEEHETQAAHNLSFAQSA